MNHIETLNQLASAVEAFKENKPGSREDLITQGRALVTALEIPSEFIQRTFWAEPAQSAIIRIAVDVRLFQYLHQAGSTGLSPAALSDKTGVDVILLERITRHLVSMNVLEFHSGVFHSTPLSNGLAEERHQHSISFSYDIMRLPLNALPAYFTKTAYRSPTAGSTNGIFQYAHGTDLPFFDWLVATPSQQQHFDLFMGGYRAGKVNWYDEVFYPVRERLLSGSHGGIGEVLLVDIGGGRGHDVAAFLALYDDLPGEVVLQDREPVVEGVLASGDDRKFKVQTHDFFTPQPVIGARGYYLHSILHDWGDDDAVRILENLVPALVKNYSRVLLNEIVVSEEKPSLAATSMDILMMAHFASRERTEVNWREILGKAGLRMTGIYSYPGVAESLIEAELA